MLNSGSVAGRAGVNKQTVRYYERIGLIPPAPRDESGYRVYPEAVVARIRFIQEAKVLGFQLREIAELLNLRIDGRTNCDRVQKKAREKRETVRAKIQDLKRMERALTRLVESCATRQPTGACPILESLDKGHI